MMTIAVLYFEKRFRINSRSENPQDPLLQLVLIDYDECAVLTDDATNGLALIGIRHGKEVDIWGINHIQRKTYLLNASTFLLVIRPKISSI
jgi:hypothetical protein